MKKVSVWSRSIGTLIVCGVACTVLAWGTPAWAGDAYTESGSFAIDAHSQGQWRLAVGGEVSNEVINAGGFGTAEGETYGGMGSIGYFVRDNAEFGVKVDGRSLDNTVGGYWVNVDAFFKYYWARENRFVPYVGAQAGVAIIGVDFVGTATAANLGVIAGFEVMIAQNVAFFAEYNGAYTSDFDPADFYIWSNTGVVGFSFFF